MKKCCLKHLNLSLHGFDVKPADRQLRSGGELIVGRRFARVAEQPQLDPRDDRTRRRYAGPLRLRFALCVCACVCFASAFALRLRCFCVSVCVAFCCVCVCAGNSHVIAHTHTALFAFLLCSASRSTFFFGTSKNCVKLAKLFVLAFFEY